MGKKRKPLLADSGIVHLKSSFVHPVDESGLLTTVGGRQEQPLMLASGNYGYGIPASVAVKNVEAAAALQDAEVDPDVLMVREINGGVYSSAELTKDRTGASDVINDEAMTVAELVRSIGGARDAPLRVCDVVEDRGQEIADAAAAAEREAIPVEDPQADEFYASLGLTNPNEKSKGEEEKADRDQMDVERIEHPDENVTSDVADFYKTYTKYYYSVEPDPYGEQRVQFGLPIQAKADTAIDYSGGGDQTIIQLARMAQARAREAKAAAAALEKAKKAKALDGSGEKETDTWDPLPMEVLPSGTAEELGISQDTTLEQYWEFVKEDPHDFNRWIYLIHYVEATGIIGSCRKVYSAFLPLFSYCFGYWKRYSDLEKNSNYYGRALTILEKGLEFIPLSVDLWNNYIDLYKEIHAHHDNYKEIVRLEFEKALNTCGMEFRSDALWEAYIKFEIDGKDLKRAFALYGRLLQVPTRLYNRHWDNVRALVRDHHPRDFLEKDAYEYFRKKGCRKLGLKYKEEPEKVVLGDLRKPQKPEDKLMDYVKEKVLKKIDAVHEKCEAECEKRWVFEDKIRRPYFHTKPLDRKQLRNWEEYLNFEISLGDHDRIVLLFERCLIACANYESFWCKYARYLESFHKKNPASNEEISVHFQKVHENVEIGSKKETEAEEKLIEEVKATLTSIIDEIIVVEHQEALERSLNDEATKDALEVTQLVVDLVSEVASAESPDEDCKLVEKITPSNWDTLNLPSSYLTFLEDFKLSSSAEVNSSLRRKSASPHLSGDLDSSGLPVNCGESSNSLCSSGFSQISQSLLSVPTFPPTKYAWQEAVRDVYKRACVIHCPKKPAIRLQWAAFEEELGNTKEARELILHVQMWFPHHLEARLARIELERRLGKLDIVPELFDETLKAAPNKDERSLVSMKYARFLHKELAKPDQALQILRKAIKGDKLNTRLYSQVVEICYGQYSTKKKPVFAALDLFLRCKDFTPEQRLTFLRKKLLIEQEHGSIKGYRDTLDEVQKMEEIIQKKQHEEELKKEEEARLTAGLVNPGLQPFPVPDRSAAAVPDSGKEQQKPVPITFESLIDTERAQVITTTTTSAVSHEEEFNEDSSTAPFKKVAPPPELNLDNYGYSSKHPDYKIAEYMAQKEYEQLEMKGYPEHIKDKEGDKTSRKRKADEDAEGPIYIVQPKSATMYVSNNPGPSAVPSVPGSESAGGKKGPEVIELEAPQAMSAVAVPSTSPCINVPEWFIKEGGELCLSETRAGFSVLRYWPHFLNDLGEKKMFKAVRRSVKWHQKQRVVWNKWRYVPRLVSWLGPCEWADRGLEMKKNEDWPPEILDLLHRINQITQHEFNSCFLNLYRTGHDSHPWHGDIHPAYGANPPVATISLGSMRLFEMKRRGPVHNFIRFPLFPGSLLIMEGACQEDWSHQIPKDPKVEGERISLVFRVMHAIESPENELMEKAKRMEEEDLDEDECVSSLKEVTKEKELSKTTTKSMESATKSPNDKQASQTYTKTANTTVTVIANKTGTSSKPSKNSTEPVSKSKETSSKRAGLGYSSSTKKDTTDTSEQDNSEDPDIEIIAVKPCQTRIIFHNKD